MEKERVRVLNNHQGLEVERNLEVQVLQDLLTKKDQFEIKGTVMEKNIQVNLLMLKLMDMEWMKKILNYTKHKTKRK